MKSFSQISTDDLEQMFGIKHSVREFIPTVNPIEIPSWLAFIIERQRRNFAMLRNEKAISEVIISPILMGVQELFKEKITIFSGEPISTTELSGICDFLITKESGAFEPKGGYFILVEAKKLDLFSGIPQCIAEMYAAQQLNGNDDTVYGCVSTGLEWIFLKLDHRTALTDPTIFTISEVPKILGVFGWIVNQ